METPEARLYMSKTLSPENHQTCTSITKQDKKILQNQYWYKTGKIYVSCTKGSQPIQHDFLTLPSAVVAAIN